MMKHIAIISLAFTTYAIAYTASTVTTDLAYWGPRVHLGPAKSEIVACQFKFQPGTAPEEQEFVALWVGLWNPVPVQYDLVQSVTSVHGRSYMKSFCQTEPGQWCTQAYVHRNGKPDTPSKGVAIDADDTLTVQYRRNVTGDGKWTQRITSAKKGRIVLFTTGNKPATVFETGTEMQGVMARNKKGTVDKQIYSSIRISLRSADPNFGTTLKLTTVNGRKAKVDRVTTTDNGKTWTIRQIVIPAMNPRPGTVNEMLGRDEDRAPSGRTPLDEQAVEPEWTLDSGDGSTATSIVQTREDFVADSSTTAESPVIEPSIATDDVVVPDVQV